MGVRRNPTGPLINSTLYQTGDAVFWGKTVVPEIEAQDDDVVHVLTTVDRIDTLAHRMLGDSQLGWVILARNNMRLWPNDFVPGAKIYVPTRESLNRRGIV